MPIRLRKLVGAILLIALVVTWALLAMALAQSAVVKANGLIEVIYYVVAGLGWVAAGDAAHSLDVAPISPHTPSNCPRRQRPCPLSGPEKPAGPWRAHGTLGGPT
jgi:hypothetical protein